MVTAPVLLKLTYAHQYIYSRLYATPQKVENPVKIGVLSTASINPASIIHPAETHPEVVLYAVASRDADQARNYAKKYGFEKSHGSYDALIADPEVELVYVATPNGLHFEWAYKALEAGKHVLVEKPFTNNAIEATKLVEKAKEAGKICMEAQHWQFHPAAHKFRQILDAHVTNSGRGSDERFSRVYDGRFGQITGTESKMTATPAIPKDDVRWKYELGGGSLMDMPYVIGFTRYALRAGVPEDVLYAESDKSKDDPRVDRFMAAKLRYNCPEDADRKGKGQPFPALVRSKIYTDLARDWAFGIVPKLWEYPFIEVQAERAEIKFYNPFLPHLWHWIVVTDRASGKTTAESLYKGGPVWGDKGQSRWSTYRYQLEAVVDKLRGREPAMWITGKDSIDEMQTIDMVYKKSGLPLRPTSALVYSSP